MQNFFEKSFCSIFRQHNGIKSPEEQDGLKLCLECWLPYQEMKIDLMLEAA